MRSVKGMNFIVHLAVMDFWTKLTPLGSLRYIVYRFGHLVDRLIRVG